MEGERFSFFFFFRKKKKKMQWKKNCSLKHFFTVYSSLTNQESVNRFTFSVFMNRRLSDSPAGGNNMRFCGSSSKNLTHAEPSAFEVKQHDGTTNHSRKDVSSRHVSADQYGAVTRGWFALNKQQAALAGWLGLIREVAASGAGQDVRKWAERGCCWKIRFLPRRVDTANRQTNKSPTGFCHLVDTAGLLKEAEGTQVPVSQQVRVLRSVCPGETLHHSPMLMPMLMLPLMPLLVVLIFNFFEMSLFYLLTWTWLFNIH